MRETDSEIRAMRKDVRDDLDKVRSDMDKLKSATDAKLEKLNKEVDNKIQKAVDNPLANK